MGYAPRFIDRRVLFRDGYLCPSLPEYVEEDESNIKVRAPPKKEKPMTKEEYEKTRKRFEDDEF